MVAIVSGNSLGLSMSSFATLGQRGVIDTAAQGRNGEQSFVNVATGNLVLQDRDDTFMGRGLDFTALRTYNSQGLMNDDNADNWLVGVAAQRIELTGIVGTAGSSVTVTGRDGARSVYHWDAARKLYVGTAGAGAFNTVSYDPAAAQFVWTDGNTGLVERYQSTGQGHLVSSQDLNGNTLTYSYNPNGTLQKAADANGETTLFDYTGVNLTQIHTVSGGVATTTVRYGYDAQNRLASVTVDLSPEDGSIDDGNVYLTTYTYDGASTRIASITQSDGSSLAFTYVQSGGVDKVASVTDALGAVTRYSYDTTANTTTVTDPLGAQSIFRYDAQGQLLEVREGATAAHPEGLTRTSFAYDDQGNVTSTTDGAGNTTVFGYDAQGNQVLQRDAAGNTITRTFNERNQLLTETVHAAPDPDGAGPAQPSLPLTTRYIHDAAAKNQLRFAISAEGRVVEYRYDSHGELVTTIEYAGQTYPTAGLGATQVPTEAQFVIWTGLQDKTKTLRTDLAYDALGQLKSRTTYAQVGTDGLGVVSTGSITQYVFDRRGLLIQEIAPDYVGVTTYAYDGLGRLLAVTRPSLDGVTPNTTITSHDDANGRTTLTLANGLVTTQAFDKAGRLVSVTQSSVGTGVLGTTRYVYDADGHLLMVEDPTGARRFMLYDEAGRKVADIDPTGAVTEYLYGADGQLRETIAYATAIDTAPLSTGGSPLDLAANLAAVRPEATAQDQKLWRLYDAAGRLSFEVDALGYVTQTSYDGASRVTSVTQFAKPLTAIQLDQLDTGAALQLVSIVDTIADPANDRTTTSLYDGDNRLIGVIDGEDYLTEYLYDAAGRLVETVFYTARCAFNSAAQRTAAMAVARASHDLASVRPAPAYNAIPLHVYNFYDARGQLVGQMDADRYVTENFYDTRGNVVKTIRYARPGYQGYLVAGVAPTLEGVRLLNPGQDQIVTQTWDAAGQLVSRTNVEGTVTRFVYDSVGQLVETTTALGTSDERTSKLRYDLQGRLIGELDGRGSLAVGASSSLADWVANGTTHSFDAAGRLASSTDANGNRTLFFYDAVGRLSYTVNAMGEVRESRYNALGQLADEVTYGTRIDVAVLATTSPGGLVTATITGAIAAIADASKDSHVLRRYNATGTEASRTDPLGHVTSYSYNAFREAVESSQALASGYVVVDTATFDRRGLQIRSIRDVSGTNVEQYSLYDAFGRLIETRNAYGRVSQQSYDARGNLVGSANGVGAIRRTSFDALGRVGSYNDALTSDAGRSTYSYYYDTAQRSVTVNWAGKVSTTVHNREGQVQVEIDECGNATNHSYDLSGNRVETQDALAGKTTSTYDKANRLTATTDANGVVTTYAYDAANRLVSSTIDPGGLDLTTRYEYDAKGQRVSVTDPRGVVTTIEFDLAGQVVRQTEDAGGLNLETVYTHDTNGTVLTVTDPNGTLTRYTYDGAGQRVKEQVDPLGLNLTRSYVYDKAGNVVKAVDANGNATLYVYDQANQLIYTIDALGYVKENTYNAEGWLTRETSYPAPLSVQTLASLGATVSSALNFQHNYLPALGTASVTQRRDYDYAGRLTYTIDGEGRVTGYTYDAAGNVYQITSYANRVDPTTPPVLNPTVDTEIVVRDRARDEVVWFYYDALNRLESKVDATGAVTRYIYDANSNLIETRTYAAVVSAADMANYVWRGKMPEVTADATLDQRVRTVFDHANRPVWRVDGAGNVTGFAYDAVGNVIEERRYATPLTPAQLAAWDGKSAPPVAADDARDADVRTVYDAVNRQTWRIDGAGSVVHSQYDSNGNLIDQRAFAHAVAPGTPADAQALALATAGLIDDAHDRHLRYVYDAVNRATWSVEGGAGGTGALVHVQYDANGNVVDRRAYANAVSLPPVLDAASLAAATAASVDDVRDVHTRSVYDITNRVAWQADGTGAVTGFAYDGFGNLVRTVQYATAIAPDAAPSSVVASANDRITVMAYDASRRLTFVVDALGGVTRTVYDVFGNVTQRIAYANPVAAPGAQTTYTDAALQGMVSANPSADRVQRYAYDHSNRLVFSIDAQGGVVESTYDGFGNVVRTTAYARVVDVVGLSATADAAEVRMRIVNSNVADAANDRVTLGAFDGARRQVYEVDALGYVTQFAHDGLGHTVATTRYALAIPATTAGTVAGIAAAIRTNTNDRTTSQTFDAAGRVLSSTDAMGFVESWSYDAVGNRLSYTNASGSVWTYSYDSAGRMTTEWAPPVALTTVVPGAPSEGGKLAVDEAASGAASIVTALAYDSLGNLLSRTEAQGRPEERTTSYVYDALGRQVKVIYPPVGVYDAAADAVTAQTLYTETTYDALGNAIANRDIGGNFSYKTYDLLGQVAFDVDALGYVTGYQRNAFGEVSDLARHGTATTLALSRPASLQTAQVRGALDAQSQAERAADRTLHTRYDRLGRAIEVVESTGFVFDSSLTAEQQYGSGAKTTRNTFSTFGDLMQVAQLKGKDVAGADIWTLTTHAFDKRGQEVASIDALGYVTTQAFDAAGNMVDRVEYAKAATGWAGTSTLGGWTGQANPTDVPTMPTPLIDLVNDRHTGITFDLANRKTSETRFNVEFSTASNGTSQRGNLTTSYGYDAVGNLTRTTDAAGASTYSYYDALGRVTAVVEPTRTSTETGEALAPLTVYRRDAYGNVVLKTEYANGASMVPGLEGTPLDPRSAPQPTVVVAPNPEIEHLTQAAQGYSDYGVTGYISLAPFEGGVPLYRLSQGTQHYYTGSAQLRDLKVGEGFTDEGIVGYTAAAGTPGTRSLVRLVKFDPNLGTLYTLVSDPAEFALLVGGGWVADILAPDGGNAGWVAQGPDATLGEPLKHLANLSPFLGDNIFVTGNTVQVLPPDLAAVVRSDRESFAQYDSLGHVVQSTDASGANHYSAYNAQGLLAKEWQTDAIQYLPGAPPPTDIQVPAQGMPVISGVSVGLVDAPAVGPGGDVDQWTSYLSLRWPPPLGSGLRSFVEIHPQGSPETVYISPFGSTASYDFIDLSRYGGVLDYRIVYRDAGGQEYYQATGTLTIPGGDGDPSIVDTTPAYIPAHTERVPENIQTLYRAYQYDALGRQTHVLEPGVDSELRYNAFGEVVAKSVNGEQGEYFDYDNAGRLWRSNAGDGVDKIALYDLQGHQTAEIRSAGSGRADLDLRQIGSAQAAAQLADVRRTDTTYDLLGRVVSQALPERLETQGGATVRNDTLTSRINADSVRLDWPDFLAGLGSGDVEVTLGYATGDGTVRNETQRFDANQAANGVTLALSGVQQITHVTVRKKDPFGNWQVMLDRDGAHASGGSIGQSVAIAAPAAVVGPVPGSEYPGAQVIMQVRAAGSPGDSGWSTVALTNFGDSLRYDATGLARGDYEYKVTTMVPGQADQVTASGLLSVTPLPLGNINVAMGVNPGAQTFEWQGPGAGDIQVLRLRLAGSAGTWVEQRIDHPAGNEWSAVNLAGLAGGLYEYELLWSHPGLGAEGGPYAHATGQISKVAGTPDQHVPGTPGTPAVGVPTIGDITVVGNGDGSYSLRVPEPPSGIATLVIASINAYPPLSAFMETQAFFGYAYASFDAGRGLMGGYAYAPGDYEVTYAYCPVPGADATQLWKARITIHEDRSVTMEVIALPYDPGTPEIPGYTIPGDPAQYAQAATDRGAYAVSQDPMASGRLISQVADINGVNGYQRPVVNQNVDRWGNVIAISDPRSADWVTTYRYNANNQLIEQVQVAGIVTSIYHDEMGRQVAVRDANGNVNGNVYDAGGNLVQELHADGGVVSHAYDAFGNKVLTIDAEHNPTWYLQDKLNRLIRTTRANGVQESQTWDEAGRLVAITNGNGETIRYAYDLRGNLVRTTLAMGQKTEFAYDALNRKISETDANGNTATWTYDYFGQLKDHTDIGGASYTYAYDNARQLTTQSNTRGQNQSFEYDAAGQLVHIKEVVNPGVFRDTFYRYDLAGRHIRETTVQDEVTYQDNFIAYDALGRMRWVGDTRALVTIDYDLAGNRTHVHTHLTDLVGGEIDTVYQYDAMNRQTAITTSQVVNGVASLDSHTLSYDANGNRRSDTHNGSTETYEYDALNRLRDTWRDGVLVDHREYDNANRVLSSGNATEGRFNTYDANGRLKSQDVIEPGKAWTHVEYTYDDVGNVKSYRAADLVGQAISMTENTLRVGEGYQISESKTTGQSAGALVYKYDANDRLWSTDDPGQTIAPGLRIHDYVSDAAGNVLYAYYTDESHQQRNNAQRQLIVNGEVLGRYGDVAGERILDGRLPTFSPQVDFSFGYQPIDGNYPAGSPGTYAVGAGDTLQTIAKGAYGDASLWYLIAEANGLGSSADLRVGQMLTIPTRVTSANNASTFKPYDPSRIVNDTPTMLAAPGNQGGCGGIGQVLVAVIVVVVAVVSQQYWLANYGTAIGATTAGPAVLSGAGATAGVAAGTATWTTGSLLAAGAVGGAVGSVAGQAVGNALGVQDGFSWKQVALSAVGAGVTAGLGGSGLVNTGNVVGDAVIRGAVANAATQGIAVATGLQSSFSWKSVAASAVSAGAARGLNAALDYNPAVSGFDLGKSLVTGIGGSLVGQAVRGGRIDAATVATDAFGNVLGDSLAAANGQKAQGVGPWSDADYENGSDVQDSIAAANRGGAGARVFNEPDWSRVPGSAGYAYGLGDNGITDWQGNAAAKGEHSASLERVAGSELGKEPGASNEDAFVGEMNAQRDLNMSVARRAANTAYNGDSAIASYQLLGGGPGGITNVKPLNSGAGDRWYPDAEGLGGTVVGQRMTAAEMAAFDALDAQTSSPQSFGEFVNPSGQPAYNANWQADLIRNTLDNAMAHQARENSAPVPMAPSPAAYPRSVSTSSRGSLNYESISGAAGRSGAVIGAIDNAGTAVGKASAIAILQRAGSLHIDRMAQIGRAAELSGAMNAVSSASKSGQAMARTARATKGLGPLGFVAGAAEISADVAGAPVNQRVETFASSTTSAAVGGVAVLGAAQLGASLGLAVTFGNPIGGVIGGGLFGIGAALGYEFGGGSNAVKGFVKDELLEFNGKNK